MSKKLRARASTLAKNTIRVTQEGWKFITKTTIRGKNVAVETNQKLECFGRTTLTLTHLPDISYDGRTFYKVFP
jgi:hypothetical protein